MDEFVAYFVKVINAFKDESATNQIAFLLAVFGPVGAICVAITKYLVGRKLRTERSALLQQVEALNKNVQAQEARIRLLSESNEQLTAASPDEQKELVERERRDGNHERSVALAQLYFRNHRQALVQMAEVVVLHHLFMSDEDTAHLVAARRYAQVATGLDPEREGSRQALAEITELMAAGALDDGTYNPEDPLLQVDTSLLAVRDARTASSVVFEYLRRADRHLAEFHPRIAERLAWAAAVIAERSHIATPSVLASIHARRAIALFRLGAVPESLDYATHGITCALAVAQASVEPDEMLKLAFDLRLLKATALRQLGKYPESVQEYDQLVATLAPDSGPVDGQDAMFWRHLRFERAIVLAQGVDIETALKELYELIDAETKSFGPDSVQADYARVTAARTCAWQGQFSQAWTMLESMIPRREHYVAAGHALAGQIDAVAELLRPREGPWKDTIGGLSLKPAADFAPALAQYGPLLDHEMEKYKRRA